MDNNKIGKYIAELRKKKKLTQQELGDKLFVTDKAVSKWERGLSLPDITILEKLADELDTDIYSILQIEKKKNTNVEKIIQEEKVKIKKQLQKKLLLLLTPFVVIICIILFKLIPFGYDVYHIRYEHNENKIINLGIPKFSFLIKNNENNYSFKNLRGKSSLKSEVKNYLNTLDHLSCNNTIYYYDKLANITVIDYLVSCNSLYCTISYNFRNGNYCNTLEIQEYKKKMGHLNTFKTLYSEDSNLKVYFLPEIHLNNYEIEKTANMQIYYQNGKEKEIVEKSTGTFDIKNDELIYYRTNIEEKSIDIPNTSNFVIKNKKLILKENYLKKYEKTIILKWGTDYEKDI